MYIYDVENKRVVLMEFLKSSDKNSHQKSSYIFSSFFELSLDSLMTVKVEPNKALPNNLFYSPKDLSLEFLWKILRIGGFEKLSLFESAILNFFQKKNASFPWKLVTNYVLESMGLNFYYYDGLQPKMSVGIINEHECIQGV